MAGQGRGGQRPQPGSRSALAAHPRRPRRTQWAQVHRPAPLRDRAPAPRTPQPRCGAGRGRTGTARLLPALRSLAGTSSLRPAGRARREGAARNGKRPKSGGSRPPPDHPAVGAGVAAESGSAAFVTPPLAVARCWGARAAAASPFFCCCGLQ